VAIPKSIRDYFHLKPHDKVHFEVKNNNILARPLSSVEEMHGIVKTNKVLSKKEMKKIIREAVLEKFKRKGIIS
jgi:bifunctional DNA-binding transcriptional regulator/antitoxin component of YhaV-PrlF toxin-antitoxin module